MCACLNYHLVLIFSRQANNNQSKPGFLKKNQYTNTKLEVRKIPPDLNNITQLNEHFSKFGTIVNIQVKKNKTTKAIFLLPWGCFTFPEAFPGTATELHSLRDLWKQTGRVADQTERKLFLVLILCKSVGFCLPQTLLDLKDLQV